jgi:hypothetical protein
VDQNTKDDIIAEFYKKLKEEMNNLKTFLIDNKTILSNQPSPVKITVAPILNSSYQEDYMFKTEEPITNSS